MNSTPILIQPDIITLSPYRKFRILCLGGAIAYNRLWENETRGDQSGGTSAPIFRTDYRPAEHSRGASARKRLRETWISRHKEGFRSAVIAKLR
jgi:hypothetical protein